MLELQSTLEELSSRVDGVKEENLRLRSENQVLGQYIENLMTASKVSNLLLKSEKKMNVLYWCRFPWQALSTSYFDEQHVHIKIDLV